MAFLSKRRLPLLNTVMRIGRITNERASQVSGISVRTISEARRKDGKPIRSDFAGHIEQAIYKIVKGATS
jgi:hypothetical protein